MNGKKSGILHSLIPLSDFKALMGVDDRDERVARFCLVTSTLSIEQYCKRRLLRKKYFETIHFTGNLILPLREYPVKEIYAVYLIENDGCTSICEPEFYREMFGCSFGEELPFELLMSQSIKRFSRLCAIKVIYQAGYRIDEIPADLRSACMELAAWNMNRYRGRRIGMTGNIKGAGKEGEHFEASMPENVRALLEPYRRKTI